MECEIDGIVYVIGDKLRVKFYKQEGDKIVDASEIGTVQFGIYNESLTGDHIGFFVEFSGRRPIMTLVNAVRNHSAILEKAPRKGTLAFCSLGTLGLITENGLREVTYADGSTSLAYVGIHLTDKISPIGSPWSSKNPHIVGHTNDFDN